jgi:hypothetical protein
LRWPDEPVLIQLYAGSKRLSMLFWEPCVQSARTKTFQPKRVRILLHVLATGVMNVITVADAADKGETT